MRGATESRFSGADVALGTARRAVRAHLIGRRGRAGLGSGGAGVGRGWGRAGLGSGGAGVGRGWGRAGLGSGGAGVGRGWGRAGLGSGGAGVGRGWGRAGLGSGGAGVGRGWGRAGLRGRGMLRICEERVMGRLHGSAGTGRRPARVCEVRVSRHPLGSGRRPSRTTPPSCPDRRGPPGRLPRGPCGTPPRRALQG